MKWVMTTGGSRGIGAAIATALAGEGYRSIFTYRQSREAADTVVRTAQDRGTHCEAYPCDSRSEDQVRELAGDLLSRYGAPYAIINNAGIARDEFLYRMPTDTWRDVIEADLNATFYMNRAFVPDMMGEGQGRIVNISSVTALRGNAGQSNYAAAKAAIIGLTKSLAVELGRFNICVNAVAPGFVATDMTERVLSGENRKAKSMIPLGRIGTVEDIVPIVSFLLGRGGSYITGQTIVVDGGMTA